MNTLYYGDNLRILKDYIQTESIDLIYLDPPFNSNRNYNVLFKEESGKEAEAQITAFEDTWHWNQATEKIYQDLITGGAPGISSMINALRQAIGPNQMMAYLVMMAVRLIELHRVLKPTGSLYLHCDPTASHYLKIILDGIFGPKNYRSEISWKRSSAHNDAKQGRNQYGNIRDILLFYTRSNNWKWTWQYSSYSQEYLDSFYSHVEPETGRRFRLDNLTAAKPGGDTLYEFMGTKPYKGRYWAYSKEKMEAFYKEGRLYFPKSGGTPAYKRYLDEMPGVPLQNNWDDIRPALGNEALGYPTQKPVELLERIILTSSNPGDIVLDPFGGCGTTISAAQNLGREWIGIDITHLAISLQKYRLAAAYGLQAGKDYKVIGEPEDFESAKQLSLDDRYQFQWWALSLIKARPLGATGQTKTGKKGSDRGIDGIISFIDEANGKAKTILVQVKSGHVKAGDIRDLRGAVDRESAAIGLFVTLEEPTREMIKEASTAGFYHSPGWGQDYPKIQIFTISELLAGAAVKRPPEAITFKQAKRESAKPGEAQADLFTE